MSSGLLSSGDVIILGVSGGPDSVALLHIFAHLRYEFAFNLHVAHFNHALRKNSICDQRFVQKLAAGLNVLFHAEVCPILPKGSLEEQARLRRFDFFVKLAKRLKANAVCLGHTRDDLAETVLMRLLRGTGLAGVRAILPQREISGIPFVRPLLGFRKRELLDYLAQNRIRFRRDHTNDQQKFFRNKIRLELIPLLEKRYNKNVQEILCNLAETVSVDYDYIHQEAQKKFKRLARFSGDGRGIFLNMASLASQPIALERMMIRLGIERLKGDTRRLTLRHVEEIEDLINNRPCGSRVHLTDSMEVRKDKKNIVFVLRKA
jgi:tRNA(Ile)-lysidine synthase